ncbi:hypothetical protein F5888DRAFT_1808281 [Russula emetica]|nr:hypothetical protein F5888DRAFT_1808281 [Russula emetica]
MPLASQSDIPCVLKNDIGEAAPSTQPVSLHITVNITPPNLPNSTPNIPTERVGSPAEGTHSIPSRRTSLTPAASPSCSKVVSTRHTDSGWSVAFSPDGQHIVSGSDDRTIHSARSVAFSPDDPDFFNVESIVAEFDDDATGSDIVIFKVALVGIILSFVQLLIVIAGFESRFCLGRLFPRFHLLNHTLSPKLRVQLSQRFAIIELLHSKLFKFHFFGHYRGK